MSNTPPLIDAIVRSMHQLGARQRVVAENIANSETPHYRARDVTAPDFGTLLAGQTGTGKVTVVRPQVVVSAAMVAMGATRRPDIRVVTDTETTETKPDGNNVTLEDQLLRMGEIRSEFNAMTNLYRKQMALINTALGRSAG